MLGPVSQLQTQEPLPPPGWYPDPLSPDRERFWDGQSWTAQTRELAGHPELWATPTVARRALDPLGQPEPVPAPDPNGEPAPAPSGPGPDYAHWAWRALAGLLDCLLLGLLCALPLKPFLLAHAEAVGAWMSELAALAPEATALPMPWDQEGYLTSWGAIVGISAGAAAAYHTLFLAILGASPGKLIARLRVTPEGQLRAPRLTPLRALARSLTVAVAFWVPILGILNLLAPLWRPKRQAFHDSWAKTVVLRRQVKEHRHGIE